MKRVMKLSSLALVLGVLLGLAPGDAGAAPEAAAPAGEPASQKPKPAAHATNEPPAPAAPAAATPAAPATTTPAAAATTTPAAATPAAAVPPPPGPAAASKPKLDGGTYAVRLRDLEARVDELKEQIRRSHTRLSLLSDTILSGGVGSARASIVFQNDMSGAFRLTRVLFVLDGAVQYNKQDESGALSGQKQIPIFKGSIPPGDHTLQVLLRLRGHGYGVFSYLRGYQFEVKQSHSFSISEGKQVDLDVIGWEKGGVTTPLEQRPAVRYLERTRDAPPPADAEGSEPAAPRKGSGG
jgi:hypothetical protein